VQFFEVLFLSALAVAIVRLLLGPVHPRLTYPLIAAVGLGVLVLGVAIEGIRWQMIPAYLGFGALVLASLKRSESRPVWRALGALALLLLTGASAFLTHEMPVLSLPEPSGPYGVGTFEYSITDHSRKERYSPTRNRELYVEVWYPAEKSTAGDFPVRTLFQELYEGDYTRQSLLFGYLEHVPTHSHVHAPVAPPDDEPFPVLLFNHALELGFTSQNQLLMEHLASHGYVILSIAHPYQSSKVNLGDAGTVTTAGADPSDLYLPRLELPRGLLGTIFEAANDMRQVSSVMRALAPFAEQYFASEERDREAVVSRALATEGLDAYRSLVSEDLLQDYFVYDYYVQNSLIQYWVEDIQFVAGSLRDLQAPLRGLSQAIDLRGFGVFGMSFGGAAAGEFCKTDSRCKAGANLDGTQFGAHWNRAVPAPFLMLYHDGHQGGNDFAYLPPTHEFWDVGIKGTTHFDFTDFTYAWPFFRTLGYLGSIDSMRMIEIINIVVLEFFDHTLKGKPVSEKLFADVPEISLRGRAVDNVE
jgi:predicted dienelactone hydrolase